MKANELRIWNLVQNVYKDTFGISHETLCDFANGYVNLKPIPLTEEWLKKFGFEKKTGIYRKSFNEKVIGIGLDGSYGLYDNENDWKIGSSFCGNNRIIFVHQLQNLYFALTNEELKFNQDA